MKRYKIKKGQGGQAMLTAILFFTFISSAIMFGIINPIIKQVRIGLDLIQSKESFFLAESATEDVLYRLQNRKIVDATEYLSLNGAFATTTIGNITNGKEVIVTASKRESTRKVKTTVALGTGVAFNYGVQSGQGGFRLYNSSSITGNVFSVGPVIGDGNMIYGDVISAGPTGQVYGIHATGSVYAHTLGKTGETTIVDKDAFYQTKVSTVVSGVSYPGSPDQDPIDLPISDTLITQWESDAAAGGTISSCDGQGNYTITSSVSIGPVKITCNLIVKSSSAIVTINGPVWVTGNITFQTGPTIRMAASLGGLNAPIIADNPSNRLTSSIISVGQSTVFQGSGSPGSFVFLISQNNSAENGGTTDAISMSQGSAAMVTYASHGQISLSQSVSLSEVTAYKIVLSQSANVTYDRGLPSTVFQSGPSGGYELLSWEEVR